MNSLYPILRRILVQVTKIATTVFLLIVLIDYIEKLIAYNFKVVYQDYDGYYCLYTPLVYSNLIHYFSILTHS